MTTVPFLIGLGLGLGAGVAGFLWQRVLFNRDLNRLLNHPHVEIPDRSGSPFARLVGAIAHQKQRATQLEMDLIALNQCLNSAPIGYLLVDRNNQVLICNPKACQLLEIQDWNQSNRLLLEVARSYEVDQLIQQTRRSQRPYEKNWSFQAIRDHPLTLPPIARPLKGLGLPLPEGKVGVFIEDQHEVMLAAQQRDRWASDVAHELRTPLTSIRLITETLQFRSTAEQHHWLDRLLNEVVRLSDLVEDLLELGRLKANSVQAHEQLTDLVSLIHLAWGSLEPLASQKQVSMMYQGPRSLKLLANEPRLHRLLLNLLDNSLKFSPPRQFIQVNLSTDADSVLPKDLELPAPADQWIYLQVIDVGCGFDEHDLPYIFERFYRADPSRARNDSQGTQHEGDTTQGSGLGLAIARQIVEAHQGVIRASNHSTGGAWLEVLLPWRT
jgi:two-component system, OmpR family, phosphate regulon sensor histidine kinase PhoR